MNKVKKYLRIVKYYEACLEKHGDSHLGVDWPKIEDVDVRHRVMLGVSKEPVSQKLTLLDFGCGVSHLYEYIKRNNLGHIDYYGLDLSEKFIELCRKKFPENIYYCADVIEYPGSIPDFDYIVMNGIFTEKRELTFDEMLLYFKELLSIVFSKAKKGVAFNVMSKAVDWEREDLFHLPTDILIDFLKKDITRNFVIRNDYGLYEYTVYIYK